jgi:hypothetical protein
MAERNIPRTIDVTGECLLYDYSSHDFSEVIQKKERWISMNINFTKNIGMLLLAIWLILTGLATFIPMGGLGVILALLAIVAGVFILIGR